MKLLFITHDASRSGAPLVLLYLMQWIKQHDSHVDMDVLFVRGGVMEPDFIALANEAYYIKLLNRKKSLLKRILLKLGIGIGSNKTIPVYEKLAQNNYDLLYSNTIVSIPHGNSIKNLNPNIKHLVHVHELQTLISTLLPNFRDYIENIDGFIAVSDQVKNNLITNWSISPGKVEVVYGCAKTSIKRSRIVKKTFTVGASGYSYWRKGNDIFLQVARYVLKHHPDFDIEFVWVGNEFHDKPIIDADIKKLDLESKVKFVGEVEDVSTYFNKFDVFLMTSREDPFPLVCIEVAHCAKPIICFENASGTSEVVKKGGGFVVPYLDIETMAEKIVFYYENKEQSIKDGEKAYELFKDFTPEKICPQLFHLIYNTI